MFVSEGICGITCIASYYYHYLAAGVFCMLNNVITSCIDYDNVDYGDVTDVTDC